MGAVGPQGPPGKANFSFLSQLFTVPAINAAPVQVAVTDSSWMTAGLLTYIPGAGTFTCVGNQPDTTHVMLVNSGDPANQPSGTQISYGTQISPATLRGPVGPQGNTGPAGPPGPQGVGGASAFTTLAQAFTVPVSTGTAFVVHADAFGQGMIVYVAGGGYFAVNSVTLTNNTLVLANQNYPGNQSPGTVVPIGNTVSGVGPQGATGPAGPAGPVGPQGPAGPPGSGQLSTDPNNCATHGSDGFLYVPLASTTAIGGLKRLSGNTSDYIDGTGSSRPLASQPLATSTAAGLLAQLSGKVSDYVGGDNSCHDLLAFLGGDMLPPVTPDPQNDEFITAGLTGWTQSGTKTGATITQLSTFAQLAIAAGTSGPTILSISKSITTAANWLFQFKLRFAFAANVVSAANANSWMETWIQISLPGAHGFAVYIIDNGFANASAVPLFYPQIAILKGASFGTHLATSYALFTGQDLRLQIGNVGSNLVVNLSNDGINWVTIYSEPYTGAATSFNGAFPTNLALGFDNGGQNDLISSGYVAFDYLRKIA
jgi:hypothetical protein